MGSYQNRHIFNIPQIIFEDGGGANGKLPEKFFLLFCWPFIQKFTTPLYIINFPKYREKNPKNIFANIPNI